MNDLIDGIIKSKREKQAQGRDYVAEKKESEDRQKKLARKNERKEEREKLKIDESKDSYLTID